MILLDEAILLNESQITPTPGVIDAAVFRLHLADMLQLHGGAPKLWITDVETGAIDSPTNLRNFPWHQMLDIIDDVMKENGVTAKIAQYDFGGTHGWPLSVWAEAIKELKAEGVLNRLHYFVLNYYVANDPAAQAARKELRTQEIAFLKSIRHRRTQKILAMFTNRTFDANRLLTRAEVQAAVREGKSIGFEGSTVWLPELNYAINNPAIVNPDNIPQRFDPRQAAQLRDMGFRAAIRATR